MSVTHGMSASLTYKSWSSMVQRCTNPNEECYARYSSLGIHPEFLKFENFLAEVGECPAGKTIDRKDNKKGYYPGNLRWATKKEQARNKSTNRLMYFHGETKTAVEWCEDLGIKWGTVKARIKRGWSDEESLSGIRSTS